MSEEIVNTGKFLTPELYWKWKSYAQNIIHSKVKLQRAEQVGNLMDKDLQIAKLKLELYKLTQLKAAQDEVKSAESEYQAVRQEIEASIEMPLKDCLIDEYTYEVKSIIKDQ